MKTLGVLYEDKLNLPPPVWTEPTRQEALKLETIDLQRQIRRASSKPPREEVADLVDVASAFALDKTSPAEATGLLLQMTPEKMAHLVDVLDPAGFDQLVRLSRPAESAQ